MKLKTPITDTREIVEMALLVMHGAACANVPKEVCQEVGKALALMVQTAERMYGELSPTAGASPPLGNEVGQEATPHPSPAATPSPQGEGKERKRAVYPDIYDHSDKLLLQERLEEYAEWAACNEWEVPLCLADDLKRAARFIYYCNAAYPRAMMDFEKAEFIQRELNKKQAETGTEEWP